MKRGVVYALSHPAWLDETLKSAVSVKQHMPDLARQLYATKDIVDQVQGLDENYFTDVVLVEKPAFFRRPRFESMLETDLEQAIFLDGDTYFTDAVDELFELLDLYDVAAAAAPQYFHQRALSEGIYDQLPPVSQAIPEWNGGVIVANVTDGYRRFVKEWMRLFGICEKAGFGMDQAGLRVALATSKLRIATLPNNYNLRANMPQIINRKVKILHAHGDLEMIASYINQPDQNRSYRPNPQQIHGKMPKNFKP